MLMTLSWFVELLGCGWGLMYKCARCFWSGCTLVYFRVSHILISFLLTLIVVAFELDRIILRSISILRIRNSLIRTRTVARRFVALIFLKKAINQLEILQMHAIGD